MRLALLDAGGLSRRFRPDHDIDAAILRTALNGLVVGHGTRFTEPDRLDVTRHKLTHVRQQVLAH